MNIVSNLQKLDDLIVEQTQPPVTAMLRNKLAFCIEQAQAHAIDVERLQKTLAEQKDAIERLVPENANLIAAIAELQTPDKPSPIPPVQNFL